MTTRRTSPLPRDWPTIRARIIRRDGHRCTWLGERGRCTNVDHLEVDHIGDPTDHSDANLRTLCQPHHARRTALQANAARWQGKRTRRDPPPHPGDRRRGGG